MTRYVALLRGINVGGNNVIRMADLKDCFERQGLEDVRTYIQSGNVLFASPDSNAANLTRRLENALGGRFGYRANLVLRTARQMEAIVRGVPPGFGDEPARFRYDVIFLKAPLTAAAVIGTVPVKEGVDQAHAGPGVLYFSRLISRAAQSRLSRVVSMPVYQSMTIRNWNTTRKLAEMVRG